MLGRLAKSSQGTYASALRNWKLWRLCRGELELLEGLDPIADEDNLVQFVYYFGVRLGFQHSTVRVVLAAIRYQHTLHAQGCTSHQPTRGVRM